MTSTPVVSNSLSAVGYQRQRELLQVKFVSGETYQYSAVPESVYLSLMAAESKGRFFNQYIRSRYSYAKVLFIKK